MTKHHCPPPGASRKALIADIDYHANQANHAAKLAEIWAWVAVGFGIIAFASLIIGAIRTN